MQKLSNTKLSKTKLSKGNIPEMDPSIPLSIKDIVPQGSQTHRIEEVDSVKNVGFWKDLLEKKK